jgi:hypothetical protein
VATVARSSTESGITIGITPGTVRGFPSGSELIEYFLLVGCGDRGSPLAASATEQAFSAGDTTLPYCCHVATKTGTIGTGGSPIGRDLADLESASSLVRRIVRAVVPRSLSGDEAREMVNLLAELERVVASGVARLTPRVVETGSFTKEGHGSAQDWLGAVSGTSAHVAKTRLASNERAAGDPRISRALQDGELSAPQIKLLADAASTSSDAPGTLLELLSNGSSHQELTDAADRLRAAARSRESERLRRARVHSARHMRYHQDPEGGIRGDFFCDEVEWARIFPILEAEAKQRWKAAGSADGASLEAHRMDALIDLLAGTVGSGGSVSSGTPRKGARPHTLILIDAEALRRGTTIGEEICEIEGIGPVSVAAATELLSEGGMQYLVREGFDIKTVTKTTRTVAQCVDMALIARDRVCVVEGCGKRRGLERDHCHEDFRDEGPTSLDNLARLCPMHHDLKTYGGYDLQGGPGEWRFIAPEHPKSAGYIARAKKLAIIQAKAKLNRKKPRLT